MLGHTDKATINQRRPLTVNMVGLLRSIHRRRDDMHAMIFRGEMTQSEKNAAKALIDRGMVGWDVGMRGYYLTDTGRSELLAKDAPPHG